VSLVLAAIEAIEVVRPGEVLGVEACRSAASGPTSTANDSAPPALLVGYNGLLVHSQVQTGYMGNTLNREHG
jgi:hypothetical protein